MQERLHLSKMVSGESFMNQNKTTKRSHLILKKETTLMLDSTDSEQLLLP